MITMTVILIMTMMFRLWCRASQCRPLEVINPHLTHHQGKDDDDLGHDDDDDDDDDDNAEKGKSSVCKPGLEKKADKMGGVIRMGAFAKQPKPFTFLHRFQPCAPVGPRSLLLKTLHWGEVHLGKGGASKTDEFLEKFQTGGGSFPIQKFMLQIFAIINAS